jgi:hypothetical protein
VNQELFRSIATTVVPEASRFAEDEWQECERILDQALSRRPPAIRRQLAILLRVLDGYAFLRRGCGLRALDVADRQEVLHEIERSRLTVLRKGLWGLRTLVLMGCYARPAAAGEIGYAAHPRGWSHTRGAQ